MTLKSLASIGLSLTLLPSLGIAQQGSVPTGIPHLDHVFVIMMENHAYGQIRNNPAAPFINQFAANNNTADNYFGVAHPSLTNYLEVVGGSNFGILNDNSPDWHSTTCTPNIISKTTAFDVSTTPNNCPIYGAGTDAATPAIDYTNEAGSKAGTFNIDGKKSIAADSSIVGKSIADQLVAHGLSWKTYQESLPITGADNVNNSDGFFSNLTDFSGLSAPGTPVSYANVVALYAVKHNPFVYFRNVEEGYNPDNSLKNVVGWEGARGLFADLATGKVPSYSFIAPNQCNDMHGKGGEGPFCAGDPNDNGTQVGLNPGLIARGDITVHRLVNSIKASPAWKDGKSAIVLLWDENDYSNAPNPNQVLFVVDTNYGVHGVQSNTFYTHFAFLKTVEAGFGLPCLNHACDSNEKVMTDLFAAGSHHSGAEDDDDNN